MRLSGTDGAVIEIEPDEPRRGGGSLVYAARGPGGRLAVKVALQPLPFGAWLERERLRHADLSSDPATASLVPVLHHHGVWDGRPFVAMERFPTTLEEAALTQRDPAQRLRLAARAAAIVARLHAARPGLVHGDLKPSNFLVDGDRMVVTDFGSARNVAVGATTTRSALYTPGFSAPEQEQSGAAPSLGWDVYGLAATVFFVVVGRPAAAPRLNALRVDARRHKALELRDVIALRATATQPLASVLARALSPDPRHRHATAASIAGAIASCRPVSWRKRAAIAAGLAFGAAVFPHVVAPTAPVAYPLRHIPAADGVAAFEMGAFEVDQGMWASVTRERFAERRVLDNSGLGVSCATYQGVGLDDARYPMICVSWYDAIRFANALSARAGLPPAYAIETGPGSGVATVVWDRASPGFRLPTDEEWEHAARAGERGDGAPFDCLHDNRLDASAKRAWASAQPTERCDDGWAATAPVGTYRGNPWGLYDTMGNASEWVWDEAPDGRRGARGAGWAYHRARFDQRNAYPAGYRYTTVGLRLARNAP